MGVFDDKKFEELDWISQATEPIDSEMNEVLALIPDEVIIDFPTYRKIVEERSYSIDLHIDNFILYVLQKYAYNVELSYFQKRTLRSCFKIEMADDIYLDYERETITGEIKAIKVASTMDEKILEEMLGYEGIETVGQMYIDNASLGRANEIMELLGGCGEALRTRSERKKRNMLKNRLMALFKNNEWKIKDTTLANKVGFWIRDYIRYGNLAALSNFCRLKVMTHKEQPIYSMEEVE